MSLPTLKCKNNCAFLTKGFTKWKKALEAFASTSKVNTTQPCVVSVPARQRAASFDAQRNKQTASRSQTTSDSLHIHRYLARQWHCISTRRRRPILFNYQSSAEDQSANLRTHMESKTTFTAS